MITDRWLPDSTMPTRQYQNIASARIYGLDLMSKQRVVSGFWVSAGYSYVESRDNETGLQLYGATHHSGNVSAEYVLRKKSYTASLQLLCKLMGEKFYEVTSTGPSFDKPYNTWRLTVTQGYRWLKLSVGIDNIFNRVIPNNLDFISPGRRYFVGANVDFGKIK
jgi:outer membrane receptor protein involved in Fe transport